MLRSLFISSSGMQAQQFNLDVIANNLANVNTTGFKKSRADFQSLLYQSIRKPLVSESGTYNPTGVEVGNGVRVAGTVTNFEQGITSETDSVLDLAIEGGGFFMVHLPDGQVGYTRGGAFRIDSQGYLVNTDGFRLLSSQGNVSAKSSVSAGGKTLKYIMPDTDTLTVNVAADGVITTEKTSTGTLPTLELANFTNPSALESVGSTAYVANDVCGKISLGKPAGSGFGSIRAGFLEGSNVKIVEEMVKMIMAQRAYEINSKSVQTADEMMGLTNNLRR